jgi:hypothetical protein
MGHIRNLEEIVRFYYIGFNFDCNKQEEQDEQEEELKPTSDYTISLPRFFP